MLDCLVPVERQIVDSDDGDDEERRRRGGCEEPGKEATLAEHRERGRDPQKADREHEQRETREGNGDPEGERGGHHQQQREASTGTPNAPARRQRIHRSEEPTRDVRILEQSLATQVVMVEEVEEIPAKLTGDHAQGDRPCSERRGNDDRHLGGSLASCIPAEYRCERERREDQVDRRNKEARRATGDSRRQRSHAEEHSEERLRPRQIERRSAAEPKQDGRDDPDPEEPIGGRQVVLPKEKCAAADERDHPCGVNSPEEPWRRKGLRGGAGRRHDVHLYITRPG